MQDDSKLKSVFRFAWFYSAFQDAIGARKSWNWFVNQHLRPKPGQKIVDIGCGTGDVLNMLPDVEYVGIDISEPYVELARRRFGKRGTFMAGTAATCKEHPALANADVVMCCCVLHHLDDPEVRDVFDLAQRNLKPDGRFVGMEPCMLRHQTGPSRWIMSKDRGQNVRVEREWRALLHEDFPFVNTDVLTGLIRLPYVHIAMDASKRPLA